MARIRKYLITGGIGFIGSNFVRHLYATNKQIEVRVLDKMTYAASPLTLKELKKYPDFKFYKGDICNPSIVRQAMDGVDVVVNFAAESAVDRSIKDPSSFLDTDMAGVFVLLEEARKQKNLKRFVQVSTDEVYGQILKGSFKEDSELKPRNPYAASKLGGERLAYSFFVTYGLPVVVTRASNNYGPHQYPEKLIPLFVTNLLSGLPVPVYGAGKQVRDWLFVEDHCRAIAMLIERAQNGEVYNIGGDQEMTNIDLTRKVLNVMGKGSSQINYVQDRPGHDLRYSLDSSKLKKLGFKHKYHIADGLLKTIKWYSDNEAWWQPLKKSMHQGYITGYWGTKKKVRS